MWDWDITTVAPIISAIPALAQMLGWAVKARSSLSPKAFFKTMPWKRMAFLAVLPFVVIGSLWIYQQINPNGDPAQATPAAHQNATPTASDTSDNPAPAKASPEDRQITLIQIPTLMPFPTPTQPPTPTLDLLPKTIPIPISPPAPTLALSPTIRPGDKILSVVVDRTPNSAQPFHVQVLSALVTGADGISIEIHNATCNNNEHITTKEWTQFRCGYDKETQRQTILEHILAWHESVGHLRCEADGIPNSSTMQFSCFTE